MSLFFPICTKRVLHLARAPTNPLDQRTEALTGSADHINLTDIVDHELKIGPVHLNLADIDWPPTLQKQLDKLNALLLAIFVLYVLGIAFAGLAILAAAAALFLALRRAITLANFALAALAALALLVGSIIITVGANEAANTINDIGEDVGVSATAGHKFIVLSWVAFAVMAAASLFWMLDFCFDWRARRRAYRRKSRI